MQDDIEYEYKSIQAMRGMEKRSIAKVQGEAGGWELVDQTEGSLRTTLKFRRVKPDTLLSKALVAFRGLTRTMKRVIGISVAVLFVLAAVGIGTAAVQEENAANAGKGGLAPTDSAAMEAQPTSRSTPASTPSASEEVESVINAENNQDFAALTLAGDYCDSSMAEFAAKYRGQKIDFDGSIVNVENHDKYKTRYDILLGPGSEGAKTTAGPAFKYSDVNITDLKFAGNNTPSTVSVGDKFRFTAEIGEYKPNQGCLFFLTPVSTSLR